MLTKMNKNAARAGETPSTSASKVGPHKMMPYTAVCAPGFPSHETTRLRLYRNGSRQLVRTTSASSGSRTSSGAISSAHPMERRASSRRPLFQPPR
jgi:hypothetical protein